MAMEASCLQSHENFPKTKSKPTLIKKSLLLSETDRSGDEQSMFTDSRLLLSSPERQPYKHTQIQVYNRYYNSDYTPYYQYCILHIPTWGSISHVNGSHIYLCHITCHTSIDRNSYYKCIPNTAKHGITTIPATAVMSDQN